MQSKEFSYYFGSIVFQSAAESALSRVRRLLSSSLPGRRTANKTMAITLENLAARPDAQDGVPFIVLRLCSYIDSTGKQHILINDIIPQSWNLFKNA